MEISKELLAELRKINTPTVSNALELFDVRGRHEGFMSPEIKCLFPDLGVMAGYAMTARFAAAQPGAAPASRYEFWNALLGIPEPRILVLEDLDEPPGVGAFVGEVMATVHQRLGCVGAISNGHFRDLDEVHALGFQLYGAGACVSHAYVHLVDFGKPVRIGGLEVKPGDLLHADKHGVLSIPFEVAARIPAATAEVIEREQRILGLCKSDRFSLEELQRLFEH